MTNSNSIQHIESLLAEVRQGSDEAFASLAEQCRAYLLMIANGEIDRNLQGKVAPSDIVQETIIKAQQNAGQFRGTTENEWRAWLRQILRNDLRDAQKRFHGTAKRDVSREEAIPSHSRLAAGGVEKSNRSPRAEAIANEEANLLRNALTNLSEEHRLVIKLRNWDRLTFEEVGKQTDQSADAARKTWARAIEKLRKELSKQDGQTN